MAHGGDGFQEADTTTPLSFDALYRRELVGVYRYCLSRLRHKQDAEDATEQTFIKALKAWSKVHARGWPNAIPWLYRIAVNVTTDFERSRQRRATGHLSLEHIDPGSGPEELALRAVEAQHFGRRLPSCLTTCAA